MKIKTVAGRTEPEPVRSTAYYYGDLERLKRQDPAKHVVDNSWKADTHKGKDLKPENTKENCGEPPSPKGICRRSESPKDISRKHDTPKGKDPRSEQPKENSRGNEIVKENRKRPEKSKDNSWRPETPKEIFRKPETYKETHRETVDNASEEEIFENTDDKSHKKKVFENEGDINDVLEIQDPTKPVLEVTDLEDSAFEITDLGKDYGKIESKNAETYRQNSLRDTQIKSHPRNGIKPAKNRSAKCDLYITQKDSLSEHLKRIEAIQNRNDKAIDHINWRSENDTCVSLTDHLIWRTDPKLTDSWRVENVNLSLTDNLKWRTDSIDRKVTCPSLSQNLKWSKDLESINLDPVVSLNERLKWKKLYEQDVKEFTDWKERVKYKDGKVKRNVETKTDKPNESNLVSEYVESNEILPLKSVPIKENIIPPLKKLSPEYIYSTPENHRYFCDRKHHQDLSLRSPSLTSPESSKRIFGETYSTAGTFPMPETKEKEPLLAELEVVGRVPLSQLDSQSTVRRSRSWYLCCPNVPDEEVSRESSWRYSSLRPVTVTAPLPGQNGLRLAAPSTSSEAPEHPDEVRAERDSLLRALSAERQRAAAQARAHDARLAELHGVIAELVRRRTLERPAIEEESDECESTTQPAGELDHDGDQSRTDQNDTSSMLSPDIVNVNELPSDVPTDSARGDSKDPPRVEVTSQEPCDTSPHLSDKDSQLCLSTARYSQQHINLSHITARCCQSARHTNYTHSDDSCEREHGSVRLTPGRCESRQAKMAARVRLRTTDSNQLDETQSWCLESAEKLALEVCAQAGYREAIVTAQNDGTKSASMWRARCARLQADCNVLQCALQRATDTAHKLSSACAVQESACVMVCSALKSADRALEAYDVLLALAETKDNPQQREAAEKVANQLLSRLEGEQNGATTIGEPLLSPGPWMQHLQVEVHSPWTEGKEGLLRAHAARLKAETVTLREVQQPPKMFSYHDSSDEEQRSPGALDMEKAVTLQETLTLSDHNAHKTQHKHDSKHRRRAMDRHWLDAGAASETDL